MRTLLYLIPLLSHAAFAAPNWALENTLVRSGTILHVVGIGKSYSLADAREEAVNQCRGSVISAMQKTFSINSKIIENERDVVLAQSIEYNGNYEGVDCIVERESIENGLDAATVYVQYRVDLAKIKQTRKRPSIKNDGELPHDSLSISDPVPEIKNAIGSNLASSFSRQIIITTLPGACSSIIIESPLAPRIIRCTHNPEIVTIQDYREVRAIVITPIKKGYLPRRFVLSKVPENLDVQFELP